VDGYSIRLTIMMPFLILGSILLSFVPAHLIHQGEDFKGTAYGIIYGISLAVTASLLHFGVGFLLNSERTQQGRQWRNKYEIGSIPVQFAGIPYALIGWAITSYNIGTATMAWVGWSVFVLGPILVAVIVSTVRRRRRVATRNTARA
jgi:hypothetical protein